mmetsp:Transcript_28322/g.46993  ORF Transcript_28322/g.46993 Transcript_28322/m.46993 type:complete len:131 (-) Transcript_28322:2350-2742(-)
MTPRKLLPFHIENNMDQLLGLPSQYSVKRKFSIWVGQHSNSSFFMQHRQCAVHERGGSCSKGGVSQFMVPKELWQAQKRHLLAVPAIISFSRLNWTHLTVVACCYDSHFEKANLPGHSAFLKGEQLRQGG